MMYFCEFINFVEDDVKTTKVYVEATIVQFEQPE